MPRRDPPLVAILAYDGLCTFEFGCAFEIFGLARPEIGTGWYRCVIAAAEPGPLRGAGGIQVVADGGLELVAKADVVVIPGWRGPEAAAPKPLVAALRRAHARGSRLVAICAGAFVLAQCGILSGRRATTHWRHVKKLAQDFPDIVVEPDALYVDEGSVLTSAGSAAGIDLCIHVVRREFGARVANSVARRLVVSAHRDGGQTQFIERPVPRRAGTKLGAVLDLIRGHLGEPWPIERMASEACMSVRGLHRHLRNATGMAPGEWLLAERLARARELLEETRLPVEEVAREVGFGAGATLRNHFRNTIGLSPAVYRSRFNGRL
jgi:AraC family transcriptional activator FtrA